MPKPYSNDLRERAVARVQAGEPVRSVALVLGVSPSSVVKWSQRFRSLGSVAPGRPGGRRPKKLVGEYSAWLIERMGRDFTVRGLVAELAERGLETNYRSVWLFIHAQGHSFKKKPVRQRAGPA